MSPQATDLVNHLRTGDESHHWDLRYEAADEIERLRADLAIQAVNAKTVTDLQAALESVVRIAGEALTEWDNDNDPRVGKILLALSGERPGYRADIDAIHAVRRPAVDVPAESVACTYSLPDGEQPYVTTCGHEFYKDADRELYDFCHYCGKPIEEDDAPVSADSDGPVEAGELASIRPALASRSEATGDPVANVGSDSVGTDPRSGEPK